MMNTIIHGDCVKEMGRLKAGSVDLVFADPPFNIGYEYDVYDDRLPVEKYVGWSAGWMQAVHRVLKPNGTFWLAIGDEYAAELKVEARKIGFHCRSWVIWYYTFGVNCKRKFTRSHAHLFHFVKDPENFVFRSDDPENRLPSARQLVYNDKRANSHGRLPDDTWIIRPEDAIGEMRADAEWLGTTSFPADNDRTWTLRPQDLQDRFTSREDTWYFPRVAGTFKERAGFHGCQMPEQLLGRIIRCCSEDNALVMDPFSGSATTAAVAKKLGRRHLAFDLSEEYVRLGLKRLEGIRVGDALDGSPEPLVSCPPTSGGTETGKRARKPAAATNVSSDGKSTGEQQLRYTVAGVIDSFARIYDGYSVDRVVADPELNSHFINACREKGLAGDARAWNMLLFRQRKAGRLADFPAVKTTNVDWADCDEFLFASEIALRQIFDDELADSLDEILCDPVLVARFDSIAARFAPGFKPLDYRWGALKLRKQAKVARERAASLVPPESLGKGFSLKKFDPQDVADEGGVYLIGESSEANRQLYAGEAINLRKRLEKQFDKKRRKVWEECAEQHDLSPEKLRIWVRPSGGEPGNILAWQKRLVEKFSPRLNVVNW